MQAISEHAPPERGEGDTDRVLGWERIDSPVGPLTLVASHAGLIGVSFSGDTTAAERIRAARSRDSQVSLRHAPDRLTEVVRQFREFFAGTRRDFDLTLDWSLTDGFFRQVLQTLHATVGYGQVLTYQALATRCGRPGASRVVGAAMGSNPLPIVVPCHRVVAADGLGGFGPGLDAKRWLLMREGVLPPTLDFA